MNPSKTSNKKLTRVVIYPKDIQLLTGKSYRQALHLNSEIRKYFNKQKHQYLTFHEFADYTGIHMDIIREYIN